MVERRNNMDVRRKRIRMRGSIIIHPGEAGRTATYALWPPPRETTLRLGAKCLKDGCITAERPPTGSRRSRHTEWTHVHTRQKTGTGKPMLLNIATTEMDVRVLHP